MTIRSTPPKPLDMYGRVNQRNPDIVALYGLCACAPTSTINSFAYLMNRYGLEGLIDDMNCDGVVDEGDYVQTVILMAGSGYMNLITDPSDPDFCKGISDDKMIHGKKEWIKEYNDLPNTLDIIIKGQDDEGVGGLTKTKPTAQFLYKELMACEDVEVGFTWTTGGGGGHWVTAYGLQFTDLDDDDIFDPDETGTLDMIDPWGSGTDYDDEATLETGTLSTSGGWLYLTYGGHTREVDIIVSESPVPEPVTMLGIFLGVCGVSSYVRRRVKGQV